MAESTPIRESLAPGQAEMTRVQTDILHRVWHGIKFVALRAFFWSYERGSWQYDIICGVIVAFIFLTPRSFFHDRPKLGLTDLRHNQGIVEVGKGKEGWHYLMDARLIDAEAPRTPGDAARDILERQLHRPVTIKSVEMIRDRNNVLLGYSLVVQR